jgi:hypothetical protein
MQRYVSPLTQKVREEGGLGGGTAAQTGSAFSNPRSKEQPQRPKLPRATEGLGLSKVASSPQLSLQQIPSKENGHERDRTPKNLLLNSHNVAAQKQDAPSVAPTLARDTEEIGRTAPWSFPVVAPLDHSMEIEL